MLIRIVTPAARGSRHGNRLTAERWARILRELGHRVAISEQWSGEPCDLLVALHARRSRQSIRRFHERHPLLPLVVAITGTDLYEDLRRSPAVLASMGEATRLVVLQDEALARVPRRLRAKTHVIVQSAEAPRSRMRRRDDVFEVCVLGHLRAVKDPFRAALAARLLPAGSCVKILHLGAALTPAMAARARAEMRRNPRYEWLGDLPHARALRVLARCRLLVLSSKSEGGANVISEALAAGVPVLSSRIEGSIGLLGRDYPGFYAVKDTRALARLLSRAETSAAFSSQLACRCRALSAKVHPHRERQAWRALLARLR